MAEEITLAADHVPVDSRKPNLAMYVTILNGVQQQIRFADAKAGFVATLNAILFGFLSTRFDHLLALHVNAGVSSSAWWSAVVLQALYLMAMAISVGSVIMSVMPRFGKLGPSSRVFFGHIVENYGQDVNRYVRETTGMDDDAWAREICAQIVETSHIALRKHQLVRRASWFAIIAFGLWRASLFAIALVPEQ